MGSFDLTTAQMEEALAVNLDGKAPAPKAAPVPAYGPPVPAPVPAPVPVASSGPGFWSSLGSGLMQAGSAAAAFTKDVAGRVTINTGATSGARDNALVQLAPLPPPTPWGWILGAGAALLVLLAVMRRS